MVFVLLFFAALVIYVYFGYPLMLLILSKIQSAPPIEKTNITPTASLIIAAYNEDKIIEQKIENCMALDYPKDKLEIIVASDGSTDRTNEIVSRYQTQGVKLITLETNRGKSAAQNHAVAEARNDLIIFTDADVMLQPSALSEIIKNFAEEKVGCVIGKITYSNVGYSTVSEGEGLYWRYEQFLRTKESEAGNFAMGSGFIAIRHKLFQPLNPDVGEDFVLPMRTAMSGYRVVYDTNAISETVLHQNKARDMLRSRIRVISKDLRGLFHCRSILNPFRYPLYSWGLISHKLLRWLVPYFLILILITNLSLFHIPFFQVIFILQIIFYLSAFTGYLWQRSGKPSFIFGIPFSFCLVNLAALVGVVRFVIGKKSGQWEPLRS